jgi:hypothetical protein
MRLGRQSGVALDHAALHLDRAAHRIDHAAKLNDASIAGALDDAAVMGGDRGVDQIAAEAPETRKCAILVAGEPAVSDDIGNQERRKLAGLAHCAPQDTHRIAQTAKGRPPLDIERSSQGEAVPSQKPERSLGP